MYLVGGRFAGCRRRRLSSLCPWLVQDSQTPPAVAEGTEMRPVAAGPPEETEGHSAIAGAKIRHNLLRPTEAGRNRTLPEVRRWRKSKNARSAWVDKSRRQSIEGRARNDGHPRLQQHGERAPGLTSLFLVCMDKGSHHPIPTVKAHSDD